MDHEPLLVPPIPTKKSPTLTQRFTLPEQDELTLPVIPSVTSITPSEFKERVIFGASSPEYSSTLMESLPLPLNSHGPSSSASHQDSVNPEELPNRHSWVLHPNFSCHKTNLHRSKSAPAMAVINNVKDYPLVVKEQFGSPSIVRQAVILLAVYLLLGVSIHWFNRHDFSATETHPIVDGVYFCIVTMCTIGYGDIIPTGTATKLFSILFVLVGFGFIDILLSGMVLYVLDLQESYLLSTVKGREETHSPPSYIVDVKKGRMRIRLKVGLALGAVVFCIAIGVVAIHFVENFGWLDSFYLSVMSVTTVGYGDRAFKSMPGRIFASIWLLVSTLAVARAFLYFVEARVDKRHRRMVKWILDQDMTVSQFFAADIDNKGFVSKSEYVVYKLKEMGKVSEKDIMLISQNFDRLDTLNFGKITLADLMEHQHS